MKFVWDLKPTQSNSRNSEGAFIRQRDGGILYAYSRYSSEDFHDHGRCDIAAIRSFDEGETWSEPEIIVQAKTFGVKNVMSVSAIEQQDGQLGIYFIVKETAGNNTLARALSPDGYTFAIERCLIDGPLSYYVFANDRLIRLQDGRLATCAAMHPYYGNEKGSIDVCGTAVALVSEDDGKTFTVTPPRLSIPRLSAAQRGMLEPGIVQHADGSVRLWARTCEGWQYEAFSRDGLNTFTPPARSPFTSPDSPMLMKVHGGVIYTVYNPVPAYDTRPDIHRRCTAGRTPLIIRKSTDDGKTWSKPVVIEDAPDRGFCYSALFFTDDGCLLCAYCRGGGGEENVCLQRLGMKKIALDEI